MWKRILLPVVVLVGGAPTQADTWNTPLQEALGGADRLVLDANTAGRGDQKPVLEIKGAGTLAELLSLITIDPSRSGGHCMCHGDVLFRFHKGDRQIAVLSYHHGKSVRWHKASWTGDGSLTDTARVAIPAWFKGHGYDQLQRARDEDLARAEADRKEDERFASFFPPGFGAKFTNLDGAWNGPDGDEQKGAVLAREMNNSKQLTIACCRAIAVSSSFRSGTTNKERYVIGAMKTVDPSDFFAALHELRADRNGLAGAAAFFFDSDFEGRWPDADRRVWATIIAEAEMTHHPRGEYSQGAWDCVKYDSPASRAALLRVVRGELQPANPEATAEQREELRAVALLVLARFGDREIEADLRVLLADSKHDWARASAEVGLALLGDAAQLRANHLCGARYFVRHSALAAIEAFNGTAGVELLIEAIKGAPSDWCGYDSILSFEKITGVDTSAGEKNATVDNRAARARNWWAQNGTAFVAKRQQERSLRR